MSIRLLAITLMSCTLFSGASFAKDVDGGDDVKTTIKQRYLKALTSPPNYEDPDFIYEYEGRLGLEGFTFSEGGELSKIISSLWFKDLHLDVEIQRALVAIKNHHPISDTRKLASIASVSLPSTGRITFLSDADTDINKKREYCTAESVGAKALATVPDALIDELTPVYDYGLEGEDFNDERVENVDIFAKEVLGGWLTGYGKVPSLGLHYVPRDKSLETKYLIAGTIHAIIEKDNSDSFLVISNREKVWGSSCGPFHSLEVSEVKETAEGEFDIKLLRKLPRVQKISQMKNGELFIAFGRNKCNTREAKDPKQNQYFFNPPIGMKSSGHIYDVCKMGSSTRRW